MTQDRSAREYGILSLCDHLENPQTGEIGSQSQRLQRLVDNAVRAEAAGFDVFTLGEHHFGSFILSAPELLLAAIAVQTERIRIGTSVTLLAHTDPVRQAERIATLDVLSNGRAEMTVARGVSLDTAKAFGIKDIDELRPRFEEYLRLVVRLFTEDRVTWTGTYRGPLDNIRLEPRPVQEPHPDIWVGGGLSTTSADLAASLGMPFFLPSLFRWPEDYLPIVEHYRAAHSAHHHAKPARIGFASYVHVANTTQEAYRRWRPFLENYRDFALTMRGSWGRDTRFDNLLKGPAICGSPAQVLERVSEIDDLLGLGRHLFFMDAGGLPEHIMNDQMQLMATEVLPHLRSRTLW